MTVQSSPITVSSFLLLLHDTVNIKFDANCNTDMIDDVINDNPIAKLAKVAMMI